MADEAIRLDGVWVFHDGSPVLEDVSLSIRPGEFLGIIGPNGGGKTTLMKVMLGLVRPDRGKVAVLGKAPESLRSGIGYLSQYAQFDADFPISVLEVVLLGRYRRLKIFRRYEREDERAAREALEKVGMEQFARRQIGQLSGGELQRVLIARALATQPRILLLDEPTASIDPETQKDFYELMDRLKEEMAIVMVSHDISAVSIYVNRLACLNRKMFYHGSTEIRPEELEETYHCPVQLIAHGHIPPSFLKDRPK